MNSTWKTNSMKCVLVLIGFYCRFVKIFTLLDHDLTSMLWKVQNWRWGTAQKLAIFALKDVLLHASILKWYNSNHDIKLATDASSTTVYDIL